MHGQSAVWFPIETLEELALIDGTDRERLFASTPPVTVYDDGSVVVDLPDGDES